MVTTELLKGQRFQARSTSVMPSTPITTAITATPNVGDFTTANGQARRRVAAYSTATGQLITAFNPVGVNARARAVVAHHAIPDTQ